MFTFAQLSYIHANKDSLMLSLFCEIFFFDFYLSNEIYSLSINFVNDFTCLCSYQEDVFSKDAWGREDEILTSVVAPLLKNNLIPSEYSSNDFCKTIPLLLQKMKNAQIKKKNVFLFWGFFRTFLFLFRRLDDPKK